MSSYARKTTGRFAGAVFLFGAVVCIARSATLTFSNTTSIAVNDSTNVLTEGTPYPSTNIVAGLSGQIVTKATVTLHGFSHSFPSDVSILLVGPQGQSADLMSETGGQNKYSVTNLTLTLDDDATNYLPVFTSLVSGVFKPTDGYLSLGDSQLPYNFPAPAPPGNSSSPPDLSVFNKTDPTGTWNLYALCDSSGDDFGNISGGWSLNLSVAVPLQIIPGLTNVVLSWPASATNYDLQSAPSLLEAAGWSNVPTAPTLLSGRLYLTNPILKSPVFYRLINN